MCPLMAGPGQRRTGSPGREHAHAMTAQQAPRALHRATPRCSGAAATGGVAGMAGVASGHHRRGYAPAGECRPDQPDPTRPDRPPCGTRQQGHGSRRTPPLQETIMHVVTAAIGLILLLLIGLAAILALVLLVLRLVREVVTTSHTIAATPPPEPPRASRQPFSREETSTSDPSAQRR